MSPKSFHQRWKLSSHEQLYQLSGDNVECFKETWIIVPGWQPSNGYCLSLSLNPNRNQRLCRASSSVGGGERARTDGLLRARQALSQLSYTPKLRCRYVFCCICSIVLCSLWALCSLSFAFASCSQIHNLPLSATGSGRLLIQLSYTPIRG